MRDVIDEVKKHHKVLDCIKKIYLRHEEVSKEENCQILDVQVVDEVY